MSGGPATGAAVFDRAGKFFNASRAAAGHPHYCTGEGFKSQISFAYSMMVRSLENLREQATLMMAFLAQVPGWAYAVAASR